MRVSKPVGRDHARTVSRPPLQVEIRYNAGVVEEGEYTYEWVGRRERPRQMDVNSSEPFSVAMSIVVGMAGLITVRERMPTRREGDAYLIV
jgi:hypothetical protein